MKYDLHELVNLRHGLGVLDGGGGLRSVQVLDVLDPLVNNLTLIIIIIIILLTHLDLLVHIGHRLEFAGAGTRGLGQRPGH